MGEDLSRYSNKNESAGFKKCLHNYQLTNKTYFNDITATNISQFYPQDGGENQLV